MTLFILVLTSPFSLFTASFWLSVYAVGIIFLTLWRFRFWLQRGNIVLRFIKGLFVIQVSLTLLLLPISAFFFQQVSVIAFFANLIAVPWMSFISIPCALLSVVIMPINEFISLLFVKLSLDSMTYLWHYLTFIADFNFSQQTISQWQLQLLFMVTVLPFIFVFFTSSLSLPNSDCLILFKAKIKAQLKKYGTIFIALIVIFFASFGTVSNQISKAQHSEQQESTWQLNLLDVGQGLSVLITREGRALLYDTGAAYPSGFNMADSVILPYLQYAGIKQLDKVFLSHSDNDHAGSLTQLLAGITVKQLVSNDSQLAGNHQQVSSCHRGMNFHWQGLSIKALWPLSPLKETKSSIEIMPRNVTKQKNDDSCVLLISDGKHKVLLTGDITKNVEQQLLALYPNLTADVLLVPHHGSKTSSSPAFIQQLSAKVALVSAGYLNRWGMPVEEVVLRYQQQGIELINSSEKGQVVLSFSNDIAIESYHDDFRPFWFSR